MKKRVVRGILSVIHTIAEVVLLGIAFCFIYPFITDNAVIGEKQSEINASNAYEINTIYSETEVYTDADKIVHNMDILYKLQDEIWDNIDSISEKKEILQAVANAEGRYLGLPVRLTVEVADLEDTRQDTISLGEYRDEEKYIYIDGHYLEICSGWDAVDCILHECRHSWQCQIAEIYGSLSEAERRLRDIRQYEGIYYGIVDGIDSTDFESYWNSDIEIDARWYAREGVLDYQDKIYEYLHGEGD